MRNAETNFNPSIAPESASPVPVEQTVHALETLATLCQTLVDRYLSPPLQSAASPSALEQRLAAMENEFRTLVSVVLPTMCHAVTDQIEALQQRLDQVSQEVTKLAERQIGESYAAVPQGGQDHREHGAVAPVH